jgi:hypothetical protein
LGREERIAEPSPKPTAQLLLLLAVPIGGGVLASGALWLAQRAH